MTRTKTRTRARTAQDTTRDTTRTGPVPDREPGDRLLSVALAALEAVAGDDDAPSAARAQAARTLLEYRGAIGRHAKPADEDEASPDTMTAADLRRELARLRRPGGK